MTDAPLIETAGGRFFEDFRIGETIRHATPRTLTRRRRLALFGALRLALRAAERGDLRPRDRLSGEPDRRPARLPCRLRQDGARRLAQRRRQPRLRRLPVSQSPSIRATRSRPSREVIGLKENSNRQTGVVHVRSRGFNQRGETVDRIRALGDGEKALATRRRRPRRIRPNFPRRSPSPTSARPVRPSIAPPSTSSSAARPSGSRTMSRATESTMSTG